MYSDHPPTSTCPVSQVLVLEGSDFEREPEDIISKARSVGAMNDDGVFFVVFENDARRVWDFTEPILREAIASAKDIGHW